MSQISAFVRPAPFVPTTAHPTALDGVLEAVRQHLDMPVAYLSVFEGEKVVFKSVAAEDGYTTIQQGDARAAEGSYCQGVLDGKLPGMIADTSKVPAALALPITHVAPVGAIISIPITREDGSVYGMFCCLSPKPKPSLNPRDVEVMTMFAGLAANIVTSKLDAEVEGDRVRQLIADTIADQNFTIFLQPIVDLKTNKVLGAEALSRFRATPYRSPDTWFADAKNVGLSTELEMATLTKAMSYLPFMPKDHRLSLNVSADLLGDSALIKLLDGPYANKLTLEITEHTEIKALDRTQDEILKLRELGISIAMDDLGAGYAGLCTMLKLKPDLLKMDRALVKGIHLDPGCQALTKALVYFAEQIGADLVAEGIEMDAERTCLLNLGVTLGQGFLFGKAQRLTDYNDTVARSSADAGKSE